jgi:GxxExxY protein
METKALKEKSDRLSHQVIGAAMDVHRVLGPGLLESAYEECFCRELYLRRIPYQRQVPLPLEYKGAHIDCSYRMDVVIDDIVIVEIKAVARVEPIHEAQLLTYLKLTKLWLGLLINFNVPVLKDGLRRLVNG